MVGRSYAIAKITTQEASASVACVIIAAANAVDARTVTESFAGEGIHLVINTVLQQNVTQPCSRISSSLGLSYVPFAQAVDQTNGHQRSFHPV